MVEIRVFSIASADTPQLPHSFSPVLLTPSPTIYPDELDFSVSWKMVQNFGTISSISFFCNSTFKK